MEPAVIRFEDNVGLVHLQAKRGYKWAQGAGAPLTYEDMFQEASVAFLLAARGFNPDEGVKFSAYFTRAAHSQFYKAIGRMTGVKRLNEDMQEEIAERKEENARRRAAAEPELPEMNYSIIQQSFSDMLIDLEDGAEPFEASIAADDPTPEELVETRELMAQAMENLSPLAKLMLTWLQEPPEEMLHEIESQVAHADQAISIGKGKLTKGMRDGVSLANVKKFISMISDVSKRELTLAEAELIAAVKQIEGR